MLSVTIAICTRNRALSLGRTLDSFTQLEAPVGVLWDVLVVDNGSTDDTFNVVQKYGDKLPISCVQEPKRGLSNARNAAVSSSRADYILWTDDDVIVSPCWLASYCTAFCEYPDAPVFGGNIIPVFEPGGPQWFAESIAAVPDLVAARDFPRYHTYTADTLVSGPYGANFAAKRELQLVVPYDPALGAGSPLGLLGEEITAIGGILRLDGSTGLWVDNADVYHKIPADRQTLKYIWSYYFSQGRTAQWGGRTFGRHAYAFARYGLAALIYVITSRGIGAGALRARASFAFWSGWISTL